MDNTKLVNLVLQAIPYPHQVRDIDTTSEQTAIRFTWRGNRFRVSETLNTEEVADSFLHGSDLAILMGGILQAARNVEGG